MNRKIKIGIDYHGVITANPVFFKNFNLYAIKNNCQIHIISGGHKEDIKKYLIDNNIAYSTIWSTVDYYDELNKVQYFEDGSFRVDDNLWNTAKAWYCAQNKIDFHIDDSVIYGKYFTTPFCLYNIMEKKCLINDSYVDFNLSPAEVLREILNQIKIKL